MRLPPSSTLRRPTLIVGSLLLLGLVGCTRSAGGGTSSTADGGPGGDPAALAALETRVSDAETSVTGLEGRVGQAETDLGAVSGDVATLDGRVTAVEGALPPVLSDVLVDDAAAAGLSPDAGIIDLEDALVDMNGRLTLADGRITTVEQDFGTNLAQTVADTIDAEITAGNITVQANVSFDPGVDLDPRVDAQDAAVEYSAATTLDEASRALRWANQIRYTAQPADSRLTDLSDNTVRPYVQEAIDILDADLHDTIVGNAPINLEGTSTVDGTPLATYVANNAGGAATAADVPVDTTNLLQDGSYDDVQVSIESLYAEVLALQSRVAALENAQVPYVLGPSTTTSDGDVAFGGQTGLRAANAICVNDFAVAGSRVCSVDEVNRALALGSYDAAALAVVQATWTSGGDTHAAVASDALHCGGLLDNGAGSVGMTVSVDLNYTAVGTGAVAIVNPGVTCDTTLPVLCCRDAAAP